MSPIRLDTLTYPDIRELIANGARTLLLPVGKLETVLRWEVELFEKSFGKGGSI